MILNYQSLRLSAANRILATLNAYENDKLYWLNNFTLDSFNFIDKKYGEQQYEDYYDNQLYGMGTMMRLVNDINYNSPLHIVLPHGKSIANVVWSKEMKAGLPIACFSDLEKNKYYSISAKNQIRISLFSAIHPFLKISERIINMKKKHNSSINIEKTSAIYFPLHSTKTIGSSLVSDSRNHEKKLRRLKEKYKEINLCIYYLDYQKLNQMNLWDDFSKNFKHIYCCGSRYDPAFLVNLAIILANHKTLITEGLGTHIFYARMANINLDILEFNDSENPYKVNDALQSKRHDAQARNKNMNSCIDLHNIINRDYNRGLNIIDRHISKSLTSIEEQDLKKHLKHISPQTMPAFSSEFNSKIFPIID